MTRPLSLLLALLALTVGLVTTAGPAGAAGLSATAAQAAEDDPGAAEEPLAPIFSPAELKELCGLLAGGGAGHVDPGPTVDESTIDQDPPEAEDDDPADERASVRAADATGDAGADSGSGAGDDPIAELCAGQPASVLNGIAGGATATLSLLDGLKKGVLPTGALTLARGTKVVQELYLTRPAPAAAAGRKQKGRARRSRQVLIGKLVRTAKSDGTVPLQVRLNAVGRRLLKGAKGDVRVRVKTTTTTAAGRRTVKVGTLILKQGVATGR